MISQEKEQFLYIDGVEEMLDEYNQLLDEQGEKLYHTIVFFGDTGCGKKFFSDECSKKVKEKKEDVYEIDFITHFRNSNYDSEKKLRKILEMIEYELVHENQYEELQGKSDKPDMFKRVLKKVLEQKGVTLIIRFPMVETLEELEIYYDYLCNNNVIMYFITEKNAIVKGCRNKIEKNIKYFECKRVKEGDGKLVIDTCFSDREYPKFVVEDVESLMMLRPIDNKMTIKELKNICDKSYTYASKNNIKEITKNIIIEALTVYSIV